MLSIRDAGLCPIPHLGETIDIKFVGKPFSIKHEGKILFFADIELYNHRNSDMGVFHLHLSPNIFHEIMKDLKKANIPIDDNLICLIGCIFTIIGRGHNKCSVVLRGDI